jgi:aminoglycoside phosphotransferase (APT) family kinase protein
MTADMSAAAHREDSLAVHLMAMIRAQATAVGELELSALRRTSGGLSRENWTFALAGLTRDQIGPLPMILRRDPAGSLLDTDRSVEFKVLKALEGTSVPTPAVHWADPDGRWLGTPSLVMDRIDGDCDWHVLNNSSLTLAVRLGLARAFLALLTDIQSMDWQSAGLGEILEDPGQDAAKAALSHWEAELRRVQLEPVPELELVLEWLRTHARPSKRTVLVHGDFKPGNALIKDGMIVAMLDWETAHLGDPLEDLGWVTNPVRRVEHQLPGEWERAQIVAAFEGLTGLTVDDDALTWWNVFSCWKLAIIVLTGLHAFVDERFERAYQYPGWLIRQMFKLMEVG